MAVTMAEYRSLSVAMVTRAAKVLAFRPWSACRIRHTSSAFATASVGFAPFSIHRKLAAIDNFASGATNGLPLRWRSKAAISAGVFASMRMALRSFASSPSASASAS